MLAIGLVSGGQGGGQRVALEVARSLLGEGRTVGALAPDDGPMAEEFRELGAVVEITGPIRVADRRIRQQLAQVLADWSAALLYSHTVPGHEIVMAAAANRAGIPMVIHRHILGNMAPGRLASWLQMRMWARTLRSARAVVCVSDQVADQVERVSGRKPLVVPNGVTHSGLTVPVGARPQRVGFVGRLDPNKCVADFLRAAAIVHSRLPNAEFVVAGGPGPDPAYGLECRKLAVDLGVAQHVEFLGSVPDGAALISSLGVFVLPSVLEGHPLVLLEAMARGVPVVVSDIPGHRETVDHRVHGLTVPIHDPEALSSAVLELLTDTDLADRLASAARTRVESEFGLATMTKRIAPLLR